MLLLYSLNLQCMIAGDCKMDSTPIPLLRAVLSLSAALDSSRDIWNVQGNSNATRTAETVYCLPLLELAVDLPQPRRSQFLPLNHPTQDPVRESTLSPIRVIPHEIDLFLDNPISHSEVS